jgi:hypothetical protein
MKKDISISKKTKIVTDTIKSNKIQSLFMEGTTMSRLFYICIAAFLVFNMSLSQSINGKWKGQMESPNGTMDLIFNFKVSGDSLSGTIESPMGELPISNAKNDGKTFSFDVNVGEMTMSHQCTVMGDSISMKLPGMPGGEDMAIILKRMPEEKKESK